MKNGSKILKLLSFPLVAYALWEIYWASKVGSLFIKWHTHLALYIFGWAFFCMLLWFLNKKFRFQNYTNIQLLFGVFFGILFLIESFLLFWGIGDTYMEKIKWGYVSRYSASHEDYYRRHQPNETFYITRSEFNYIRKCNSLGFADIEWSVPKKKNEKRILVLGDSFTEGVGAPFDSNYVSILRNLFSDSDSSITLMNAGSAGDDPCVNYICYKDLLVKYKPDIIVQSLSANDLNTDIATKGGLERFQKNGKIKFREGPWWEPIYALSYVSRLFFTALGYNELLIKTPFTEKEKQQLNNWTIELFEQFSAEVVRQNSTLVVVLQPDQSALYKKEFEYNLTPIAQKISTFPNIKVANLLSYYLTYFETQRDSIKNYYWLQDGHHNPKGYYLMAKAVKCNLDSLHILDIKNQLH